MKITDIKIERFSQELVEPFFVAFGEITQTDNWIIKVMTDEGVYGLGSCAPLAFVTGETFETCYLVIKELSKALIGFNPLDIAGAHALMDNMIYGNGSAKCGIDIALYDIMGKVKNLPLYRLLGGTDPVVHNDITIGIGEPEYMAQTAKRNVFEDGFDILKIKTGVSLENDLKALALIRQAVGGKVRIRIDANQGYNVQTALSALKEFEKLGVEAAEQCLPWWDFEGAAELKQKNTTSVKLMLDESIHNHHDARRAATLGCADFYNIKLMKCGGLYGGIQIADIAQSAGVGCMVGCMEECKISLTAGVSLVAAKKSVVEADCDSFMFYTDRGESIRGGFQREGGHFNLTEKPGLGILEEDI